NCCDRSGIGLRGAIIAVVSLCSTSCKNTLGPAGVAASATVIHWVRHSLYRSGEKPDLPVQPASSPYPLLRWYPSAQRLRQERTRGPTISEFPHASPPRGQGALHAT